jgi:hypothetical protein
VVTDDEPELELCEEPLEDEPLPELPLEDEPLPELPLDEVPVPELPLDEEPLPDEPLVEVPVVEVPVVVVVDPFDAFVVVAAELVPRLPVAAITPKASAKVASAAAVIRRRIILMRRARSRSRLRTSGFEVGVGVAGMPSS